MQTQIEQIAQSIKNLPLEDLDKLQQVISDERQAKREKQDKLQKDIERWQKTDAWLRENRHKYMGQWVCLYGDELIAHGTDALKVDAEAKAKGIEAPLLEHIVEELPWGRLVMSESLEFDKSYQYNTLEAGITVTVRLFSGENVREVRAKVDTGASYCIFERKHAERLGIDVESGEVLRFGTATGTFLAYGHELNFTVLDIEFTSTVYFAAEESFTKNVLGQTGWLNRVKLGLIDYEGKLFLSSYNE